jgi:hypothetical protein
MANPIEFVRQLAKNILYNRGVVGSVSTSLSRLLQTRIDAAEFGADPSLADNSGAITNAMIEASKSLFGGKVYLGPGVYDIASRVKMRNRVRLEGAGNEATILRMSNGSNINMFDLYDGFVKRAGLSNLCLDGNKANNTTGNCIYLNSPDLTPARGQDYYLDMRDLLIRNSPENGIKIDGVGVVGSDYYNIRACTFERIIITDCVGRGILSSKLSDSVLSNIECYNNGIGGINLDLSGNLRLNNLKTYANGKDAGADLAGIQIYNSARSVMSACESQEEFRNGVLFDSCSNWSVGLIVDRNGRSATVPGYALGYGVKFNNCSYFDTKIIGDNYLTSDKWQDTAVILNNCSYFNNAITSKNQITSDYLVTGTENFVSTFINGRIVKLAVGVGNTSSTLLQQDQGAGFDGNFSISVNVNGTSNAAVSLFRPTSTTGIVEFVGFKGDGTNTKNFTLSGRGQSFVCLNNGAFGVGVSPSSSGAKLQVVGGMRLSTAGSSTNPGDGNLFADGYLQGARKSTLIGAAGTFTSELNSLHQVDSFFLCNTTLPVIAPAGTWVEYVDANTTGFAVNPLTINPGSGWTIQGASSLVHSSSGQGVLLVSNGTNRWHISYQGKLASNQEFVIQTAHGFTVDTNLRSTGSGYVKAQANSAANAKAVCGRVVRIVSSNAFILQDSGVYGSGFTPGAEYWLSSLNAGQDQTTAPSTTGQVQLPVGMGTSSGQFRIRIQSGTVNP